MYGCANNNPGVKKWQVNSTACLRFWQQNGADCANCIAACPLTYGFEWSQCMECIRCDTTHGSICLCCQQKSGKTEQKKLLKRIGL